MRYIEVISDYTMWNIKLTLWDRFRIGKFTRENVARWLEKYASKRLDPGWWAKDFHAVCGDIDIPWATKEGRDCYNMSYSFDPKDKVAFDQLPEQLRKHYEGVNGTFWHIWLKKTQATLQFSPSPKELWIECWEKTASGEWVRTRSGRDDFVMGG